MQADDELDILVWNQPKLSGTVRVRPDGNVTLPLIGDVAAAGLTPEEAADAIMARLTGLVVDPKVTVTVVSIHEHSFSVVGAVQNAGRFPLRSGDGVLQGLAAAGGLSEFADRDGIFVLRAKTDLQRIRFKYADLVKGVGQSAKFRLRDGDTIIVEE